MSHPIGPVPGEAFGDGPSVARHLWRPRVLRLVFGVMGCLWVVLGVVTVGLDPGRWSGWTSLAMGVLALLASRSAVLRTDLAWPRPGLEPDEQLVAHLPANFAHRGLARGGLLALTDRRLLFEPNTVEAATGAKGRSWPRSAVVEVAIAPRGPGLFSGALRRRLELRLGDGTALRFVVADVERTRDWMTQELEHDRR